MLYYQRMSERCLNCFRPVDYCLCKYIQPVDTGIKFVFLMHPKEAKHQRTGTGRLAHCALTCSEILIGLNFSGNSRLEQLLHDDRYFPVLLYPGAAAWTAADPDFKKKLGTRKLLVLVIDATWFCSRKIIEHNPELLELPQISFSGNYRSEFTFKREPRPEYISTIESCYYLVKELQNAAIAKPDADPGCLMTAFRHMIKDQLQAENERIAGKRPGTHGYDWKYKTKKTIPAAIDDAD